MTLDAEERIILERIALSLESVADSLEKVVEGLGSRKPGPASARRPRTRKARPEETP